MYSPTSERWGESYSPPRSIRGKGGNHLGKFVERVVTPRTVGVGRVVAPRTVGVGWVAENFDPLPRAQFRSQTHELNFGKSFEPWTMDSWHQNRVLVFQRQTRFM